MLSKLNHSFLIRSASCQSFCFCGSLPTSFLFFCNQPGPQVVASGRREQSGWFGSRSGSENNDDRCLNAVRVMAGDGPGATRGEASTAHHSTLRTAERAGGRMEEEPRIVELRQQRAAASSSTRRSTVAVLWTMWSTGVSAVVHVSEAARWVGRCVATSW